MSWAIKRRLIYTFIVFAVIGFGLFLFYETFFAKAATCFDGKQNQDETGVDCGGNICSLRCSSDIQPLVSLWDPRVFNVAPGVYSIAVFVENPNGNAGAKAVPFSFKIYDAADPTVLIKEIDDTVDVYPGQEFPILETGVSTGKRAPGRVVLTFNENAVQWNTMSVLMTQVKAIGPVVSDTDSQPLVTASAENDSSAGADNVDIIAILSDKDGNAIGASRTFIQHMDAHQSLPITFTWPTAFADTIAKVDLYPIVHGNPVGM